GVHLRPLRPVAGVGELEGRCPPSLVRPGRAARRVRDPREGTQRSADAAIRVELSRVRDPPRDERLPRGPGAAARRSAFRVAGDPRGGAARLTAGRATSYAALFGSSTTTGMRRDPARPW